MVGGIGAWGTTGGVGGAKGHGFSMYLLLRSLATGIWPPRHLLCGILTKSLPPLLLKSCQIGLLLHVHGKAGFDAPYDVFGLRGTLLTNFCSDPCLPYSFSGL